MSLTPLHADPARLNIATLLTKAAEILAERGHAKGAVRNPFTGAVDITGALELACGVRWKDLTDDLIAAYVLIPQINLPVFLDAWEAVDATVDGLDEWQDSPTISVDDIVRKLIDIAQIMRRRMLP